jgi:hypothetical protein
VILTEEQATAVAQCFADFDENQKSSAYEKSADNGVMQILTPRGSALLAQRVNYALDKDSLVASLINNSVADRRLLIDQYGQRLCLWKKPVVFRVEQISEDTKAC